MIEGAMLLMVRKSNQRRLPMQEDILTLEREAMERWRSGDPLGWAEISTEDVTYVDPGLTHPILNLDQYSGFLRSLAGLIHYEHSEFLDPRLVIAGDAALLTYNYRSCPITADCAHHQTLWNTTEVYFRRAGQWKIVHTHWSYVRHQLPTRIEIPLPVQLSAEPYPGVLGELMALETTAMERWRKGDPQGFIEISAPDTTYFDTGTLRRINGRDALAAEYAQRAGKIFYDVMDFIDPIVRVCDDTAVLFYRFLSTWLQPDGSIARRTPWNCTEVFTRRAGRWQIIHTHWSFIGGKLPDQPAS
jgi:uncharacterized protein (TIGR02246 family)